MACRLLPHCFKTGFQTHYIILYYITKHAAERLLCCHCSKQCYFTSSIYSYLAFIYVVLVFIRILSVFSHFFVLVVVILFQLVVNFLIFI